jgi:hypothetical protein
VVGLGYSMAAPTEETLAAQYEHRGKFDYTVYLKPSVLYGDAILTEGEEEEVPMIFFRNIIDMARLNFRYNFDSSQSVANVTNEVVVSIIAEDPGLWQKEMIQLNRVHGGLPFESHLP